MKKMNLNFIVILSLLVFTACSRPTAEKTKFTLTLPIGVTNSAQSLSLPATAQLGHVVINITGIDMPPFVFNWDAHNGPAPAEFSFFVNQGENRLIQVLYVYNDSADQTMLMYYGDVTLNFNSSTVVANVPIIKISQAPSVGGQVMGRYLTSATGGPTGPVQIMYAPPASKPSMIIEHGFIYDGWFSFMALTGVNFTYNMPLTGQKIFGGPVNLESSIFNTSDRVMKLAFPISKYSYTQNSSTITKIEGAEIFVWGWFMDSTIPPATQTLLQSTKKVCRAVETNLSFTGLSERGSYAAPATKINYSEVAIPTLSNLISTSSPVTYAAFQGGVDAGSCSAMDFNNEFKVTKLNLKDGKDNAAPFKGPLQVQDFTQNKVLLETSGVVTGKLLPSVAVSNVVAYIIDPTLANNLSQQNGSFFDCVNPPASKANVTATVTSGIFSLNFATPILAPYFPNSGEKHSVGLCFKNGGYTYPHGLFRYNGSSGNGNTSIAYLRFEGMNPLSFFEDSTTHISNYFMRTNTCYSVTPSLYHMVGNTSAPWSASENVTLPLTSFTAITNGGNPVFYKDSTCGTPLDSNVVISTGTSSVSGVLFMKSSSSYNDHFFNIEIQTAGNLSIDNTFSSHQRFNFQWPLGVIDFTDITDTLTTMNVSSCYKLTSKAINEYSGNSNLSLPYSVPMTINATNGTLLYSDSSCTIGGATSLSTGLPASTSTLDFYVKPTALGDFYVTFGSNMMAQPGTNASQIFTAIP